MNRRRKRRIRILILSGLFLFILAMASIPLISGMLHPTKYIRSDETKLEVKKTFLEDGEVQEEVYEIPRGASVVVDERGPESSVVKYKDLTLSIPNENLVDSRVDCVDIDTVYPRRLMNLQLEKNGKLTDVVVQKGEAVKVVGTEAGDLDPETGIIDWFEVEKDGKVYYLSGANVELSQEAAMKNYGDVQYFEMYDPIWGEGYSQDAYVDQIDYKGYDQPNWSDNPLPDDVHGIHITLENLIKYKDELIQMSKESGLNALVVALKGPDGQIFYGSDVPEDYFDDTSGVLPNTIITKEDLKKLVQDLKDAGFYMIGRMETFADSALALEHPEWAITDENNQPAIYSDSYWVSAHIRDTWEYNADLAREFAELGFNEVEFDFCRFPDIPIADEVDGKVNLKNSLNESKVSAIQGFLYYIRDQLEPLHVYTAADLYSGPVVEHYDYNIGHFYPALAAAANVVDPMIYLDTFPPEIFGYDDSEADAENILRSFTESAESMAKSSTNPAQVRSWVQGYGNTSAERLAREITGIYDTGNYGWLVWTDKGDLDTLQWLEDGYLETPQTAVQSTAESTTK